MKFLLKGTVLFTVLVILTILSLFIGVGKVSITDIFHLTNEQKISLFQVEYLGQ